MDDILEVEGIERMQWSACSPDINPIEHVRDALGMHIGDRPAPPTTVPELHSALMAEWPRSSQELIVNLIAYMLHRCEPVLVVRGDHTPY